MPSEVVVRVSGGGHVDETSAALCGIVILTPVAGQVVTDGTQASIGWRAHGAGEYVRIQYATSESLALEPSTWITVCAAQENATGLNAYTWTVDAMPNPRSRIRIQSISDIHIQDITDEFTVEVAP
jgi:hypothetical protein